MIKTMVANNLYIEYKVIFDEKEDLVYVPKDKALYVVHTGKIKEGGVLKTVAQKRKLNLFDFVAIRKDTLWDERQKVLFKINMNPDAEKNNPLLWVQEEDLVDIGYPELMKLLETNKNTVFFNYLGWHE